MKPATLTKQPTESRVYTMDFSNNMDDAESLASVTSVTSAPTGLTVGTATAIGKLVAFRLSSGTSNTSYKITVVTVTSMGNTLEGQGFLMVKDK